MVSNPTVLEHWISTYASGERPAWCAAFTKLQKPPRRRPCAVFDIETADGTLLGPPGGIAFTSELDFPGVLTFGNHSRKSAVLHFLTHVLSKRYRGYVFYAHKGMSFDLAHILGDIRVQHWLTRNGFSIKVDRSFAIVKKHKHSWFFGDSMRFFNWPLDDVLKAFAPHIKKAKLPKGAFSWHNHAWKERIINDTRGLYEAIRKLEAIIVEAFGVPLSLTMPSTALKAARTMLPIEEVKRPARTTLDWIRAGAYSGGRIEALYQGVTHGNIYVFDINSAYAWALKQPFPIGAGVYTRRERANEYWIARAKIVIPTNEKYPPVLSRLYHHNFPMGTFEALITCEDAAYVRANKGSVKFIEGFTWDHSLPVLADFINACERLRKTDYKGPLGQAVKLAQNGLYGILGMNAFRKVQALSKEALPFPWVHAFDTTIGKYIPNTYEATFYRESANQMPHWAAIITARVRLRLTQYLHECVKAKLTPLYVHTDSIWVQSPNGIPASIKKLISEDYGALKIECEGTRAIVIAPGEGAVETKDGWKIASKGWKIKADPNEDKKITAQHTAEAMLEEHPRELEQTQIFRAGTAMKRASPGRIISKMVCSYSAMRNRRPPRKRPGATMPHEALAYNYDYWALNNWHVGKLLSNPPKREAARVPVPNTRRRRLELAVSPRKKTALRPATKGA